MKESSIPAYMTYVEGVGKHTNQKMSAVNNLAFIKEDGTLERHKTHFCYGDLDVSGKNEEPWDYVLLQVNDEQAYGSGSSKEVLHTYYEWLLNYSLFHTSFVSKDIGKVMQDRVIIIDPSIDSRLVINSMVAARMAWEGQYNTSTRIAIWYDMIKMGVDPAQAFTLCSCLTSFQDMYKMQTNNNHEVFVSTSDVMHLNFLEHKLNPEGKSFKDVGGYKSIGPLFLANRSNGLSPWDFINERWKKTVQSTNVFGSPVKAAAPVPKGEFLGIIQDITTDYTAKLKEMKIV